MDYSNKVLLLNATYEPLTVTTCRHAICLYCKEKVQILETKEESWHSAHEEWPKPSVVRLIEKVDTPRLRVKFTRENVYRRDDYTCQYCGEEGAFHELTYDHVLPQSRGGETGWENIVTCCFDCNVSKKGDKTPSEAGLSLNKRPKKPRWTPIEKLNIQNPPDHWEDYLWS